MPEATESLESDKRREPKSIFSVLSCSSRSLRMRSNAREPAFLLSCSRLSRISSTSEPMPVSASGCRTDRRLSGDQSVRMSGKDYFKNNYCLWHVIYYICRDMTKEIDLSSLEWIEAYGKPVTLPAVNQILNNGYLSGYMIARCKNCEARLKIQNRADEDFENIFSVQACGNCGSTEKRRGIWRITTSPKNFKFPQRGRPKNKGIR